MVNYRYILGLIALLALWSVPAHAANFSGPGIFMSGSNCTDITSPVLGKTICWDTVSKRWSVWNGSNYLGIQGSWLVGGSPSTVNSNQTTYISMQGVGASTTETGLVLIAPIPARACNLTCDTVTGPAAGKTWTFVFQASGLPTPLTPSALTCTISSTSGSTCSDLVDCVNLTVGEAFDVKVTATGSPTNSQVFCSATVN